MVLMCCAVFDTTLFTTIGISGDLALSWGGNGKSFCRPNFRMTFFKEKIHFLVVDRILSVFTVWNLIYNIYGPFLDENPLFHRKYSFVTPFFNQFILSHASENTTTRNIGGTDAWAAPHHKFWETVPLSLRP